MAATERSIVVPRGARTYDNGRPFQIAGMNRSRPRRSFARAPFVTIEYPIVLRKQLNPNVTLQDTPPAVQDFAKKPYADVASISALNYLETGNIALVLPQEPIRKPITIWEQVKSVVKSAAQSTRETARVFLNGLPSETGPNSWHLETEPDATDIDLKTNKYIRSKNAIDWAPAIDARTAKPIFSGSGD